ncbi:hypothetical protein Tco_1553019 [Tanacetum coccineum]
MPKTICLISLYILEISRRSSEIFKIFHLLKNSSFAFKSFCFILLFTLSYQIKNPNKIDADYQLAERLQAQEQKELSVEEKTKLFQQLLEQRRKHFAAKITEEKRNEPPTQAQQRKIMCTYLKKMEGKKLKDLKNKSFDNIQKMFDRAFKRVNTFVDFRTDLVEGSSKRAGEELEHKSTKKQKVDEDKEPVCSR